MDWAEGDVFIGQRRECGCVRVGGGCAHVHVGVYVIGVIIARLVM